MIWIGTSGYNYPEWRGSFYPHRFPAAKMLPYYAAQFSTVEINYTFYRMPTEKVLADWARETPEGFVFTLKASRRITHNARLRDCEELLGSLWTRARTLENKLGILLFQLPPWFKKDLAVLDAFLALMPSDARAAFEFRNDSWFSDEVYTRLADRNLAMCVTDSEEFTTPITTTADYGYFRLRDEGYQEPDIAEWAKTIAQHAPSWKDVFVYFKHEGDGKGPEFARMLSEKITGQVSD